MQTAGFSRLYPSTHVNIRDSSCFFPITCNPLSLPLIPPPSPRHSACLLDILKHTRTHTRRTWGGGQARLLWLLGELRRRERTALWAALRDVLPEHIIEGVGRGAAGAGCPHSRQAVVLQVGHSDGIGI